jgi:hypothetical protein
MRLTRNDKERLKRFFGGAGTGKFWPPAGGIV